MLGSDFVTTVSDFHLPILINFLQAVVTNTELLR